MTSKNYQIFNPLLSKETALATAGITSGLTMVLKFPGLSKGGYKSPLSLTNYKEIRK